MTKYLSITRIGQCIILFGVYISKFTLIFCPVLYPKEYVTTQ
jgi:hypothetical protein